MCRCAVAVLRSNNIAAKNCENVDARCSVATLASCKDPRTVSTSQVCICLAMVTVEPQCVEPQHCLNVQNLTGCCCTEPLDTVAHLQGCKALPASPRCACRRHDKLLYCRCLSAAPELRSSANVCPQLPARCPSHTQARFCRSERGKLGQESVTTEPSALTDIAACDVRGAAVSQYSGGRVVEQTRCGWRLRPFGGTWGRTHSERLLRIAAGCCRCCRALDHSLHKAADVDAFDLTLRNACGNDSTVRTGLHCTEDLRAPRTFHKGSNGSCSILLPPHPFQHLQR